MNHLNIVPSPTTQYLCSSSLTIKSATWGGPMFVMMMMAFMLATIGGFGFLAS